jgi:hypothetical protein
LDHNARQGWSATDPKESRVTRDEILDLYRRDRANSMAIQTGALDHLSSPAILRQAKRLGLARGNVLSVNHEDELTLVFDLLLYTVPQGGRSRGIDRYARAHPPDPGSDEERVLSALLGARFSLVQIKDRHPTAGLILEDLLREEEIWLMDESLEASAQVGAVLGTRLAWIGAFAITCGVLVPLDATTLHELAVVIDEAEAEPSEIADDPRFAESLYSLALQLGLTSFVGYR